MDILRGTGRTFSTSGQGWQPYQPEDRKIVARRVKAARLIREGKHHRMSKDEMRELSASIQAAA